MSQILYNRYMGIAMNGLIADAEFTAKDGLQAAEAIGLGLAVVQQVGLPNKGRLPKANKSTIVFAGDLVTSNVVNLKVNGNAMAPVTFSSTHAATMALIVTAIKAIAGVANAVLDTSDVASRTIIVYATDGLNALVTDIAVTSGSTPTTGTATVTSSDVIYGVSIFSQAIQQPYPALNAPILYNNGAPVGCLLRGRIWTTAETVVTNGDPVYMRFLGDHSQITAPSTTAPVGYAAGFYKDAGNFRNDSDSDTAILVDGMIWRSVTTAVGQLAMVDINQPQ